MQFGFPELTRIQPQLCQKSQYYGRGRALLLRRSTSFCQRKPQVITKPINYVEHLLILNILGRHPSQFKQMAVDSQVRTPSGHTFDVLYVGTTKGRVLKLVNTADPNGGDVAQRPVFIEEMQLYPSSTPIDKLKVVRDENGGRAKLVVLTQDQVAAVPLARCAILAKSCGVCVALQDPYCAWSVRDGQCISLVNSDPDRLDSAAFLQNVFTGQHEGCGHDSSLEATGDLAQTGIRMFLPGKEEFHPQASGSIVKAPAVQEKEPGQPGIDLEEKENFEDSILPGTLHFD